MHNTSLPESQAWSNSAAAGLARRLKGRRAGRRWLARCPAHPDRSPSLVLWDGDDGRPAWHCYAGCASREVRDALARLGLLTEWHGPRSALWALARHRARCEREEADELARRRASARELVRAAGPIGVGDLAQRYLASRGLPAGGSPFLRFGVHRSASGRRWPALVAAACVWPSREPAAAQVTPLGEPGRKAWSRPARLTLGRLRGAAVRLAPWQPGRRLVLCEGVEDGLAVLAACPDVSPWAVLGAANAPTVALPEGAEVVLCLDGDGCGRKITALVARALWTRGFRCRAAELPDGADPNELLLSAGP